MTDLVKEWVDELSQLLDIARIHPHAAHCVYIHGLKGKCIYLARTIPNIGDLLQPLETTLQQKFIPAITGRPLPGDLEREMLVLPARLGGLAITIPSMTAESEHKASLDLTASFVSYIKQKTNHQMSTGDLRQIKVNLCQKRMSYESEQAKQITQQLPEPLCYAVQLASEKGASSWPTVLPVQEHTFSLHKEAFRDALSLQYGWTPERLSSYCVCGHQFHPDHELSCPIGAFPTRRHNEIQDLLATLIWRFASTRY